MTLAGLVLASLHILGALNADWLLAVAAAACLYGGFAIFQGWRGWCVLRAIGFKTRI